MKLNIINLQKLHFIDKNRVKKLISSILKVEKKNAELNLVFTDNKKIKKINKTFLGHNFATDVISFGYNNASLENNISGEIIISVEMAVKLAQKLKCTIEGEIALYLVHGLLHLLGYNDKLKKDARKMHQREKELLSMYGYDVSIPY
ncbi:MAG TPA: rRNA maturation RNase YbeY [Candidatus Wujingus californicus]|uniref:rRNA maturation RNase YbeY n=1 Tax=Candidatus Wujingus californicus TaxID=3367618 RepID=UPI001D5D0575|nr:rRNA maturation RNase YbeY [Planctomycetota bacterium]MDO8130745.1 rRNA maturation RNase YbeY [Candidatus Brocadiales bacterium]